MANIRKPTIYDPENEEDIFENLHTLEVFPELHSSNHVTVCEINTDFQSAFSSDPKNPPGAKAFTSLTDKYVLVTEESLQPKVSSRRIPTIRGGSIDEDGFLIKLKETSIVKAAWDGWNDDGLEGVLKELRRSAATPDVIISSIAKILNFHKSLSSFWKFGYAYFHPHLALATDDLIQNYAPVRQWKRSWVKAVAWHPNYSAFALALNDDTVRVVAHEENVISLLRNYDQRMVSSMAWRPFSAELAVGVETGLLVWHVRGSLASTSSHAKLHRLPGHCPITSLDYSSNGRRLVTSSASDNCLVIWNTDSWKPMPLTRIRSGGIPRAAWSSSYNPNIFCTTPTSLFLIWTFQNGAHSRKWNTARRPVEAFVWSPCGSSIIFVTDSILYILDMKPGHIKLLTERTEPKVTPLFNLKACTIRQSGSALRYKAGGKVQQLDWDQTGNRLAVLFSDSELVAVFRVQSKPTISLIPAGFVQGQGELPVAIAFHKNFSYGALLLIAWSSRRIQYFPMIFSEPSNQTNLVNQEPAFYIKYRIQNLTSLSGVTSTEQNAQAQVDFGPCFSEQPHSSTREESQGYQTQASSSSALASLSSAPASGPKLFSMKE